MIKFLLRDLGLIPLKDITIIVSISWCVNLLIFENQYAKKVVVSNLKGIKRN